MVVLRFWHILNSQVCTGMDSIMYVKSLSDDTNMVNVIKDFEQVTLSHVLDESEYYNNKFDSYDLDNDTTARLYPESTLDPSLLKELDLRQEPGDSAAVTWLDAHPSSG